MKTWMRWLALGPVALAALGVGSSPAAAQEEKNWSVELGVDYSSLYMFRGLNLLGEDQEVWTPRVVATFGNFSAYYYGYMGKFDTFDDDGNVVGDGDYGETDFGLDYTFSFGEKFALTLGAVTYMYSGETETGLGYADTYEVYAIASWDVPLAPTISYYHDIDVIDAGFLTVDISHSVPLTDSLGLDLSAQLGLDFGYNQPGDPDAGIDESNGDLHHLMFGADFPLQLTDAFSMHALIQYSISLDVADELDQPDELIYTVGAAYSF